jgi:hypothetical protein
MIRNPTGVLVMALALVVGGCGGSGQDGLSAQDQQAVDQAINALVQSGFSQRGASCYVNGLVDTFGIDRITEIGAGGTLPSDVSDRAAQLLVDCDVFGDLGSNTTVANPTGTTYGDYRDLADPPDQVDGPYDYGDDATLDALWDECAAGSGEACDSLFFDSPIGSMYEAFGNTCGNRPELDYDCSSLTP